MESVTLKIKTGNAAFTAAPEREVARILHRAATRLEVDSYYAGDTIALMDANGNNVGKLEVH